MKNSSLIGMWHIISSASVAFCVLQNQNTFETCGAESSYTSKTVDTMKNPTTLANSAEFKHLKSIFICNVQYLHLFACISEKVMDSWKFSLYSLFNWKRDEPNHLLIIQWKVESTAKFQQLNEEVEYLKSFLLPCIPKFQV